jgi:hypothetical protein
MRRLPCVEIREADIAAMGPAELEQLIDRAVRPDVPLRVLFAALDRYTELLRPALEEEPAPDAGPEPQPDAGTEAAALAAPGPSGPSGPPGPLGPFGPPGPPQ